MGLVEPANGKRESIKPQLFCLCFRNTGRAHIVVKRLAHKSALYARKFHGYAAYIVGNDPSVFVSGGTQWNVARFSCDQMPVFHHISAGINAGITRLHAGIDFERLGFSQLETGGAGYFRVWCKTGGNNDEIGRILLCFGNNFMNASLLSFQRNDINVEFALNSVFIKVFPDYCRDVKVEYIRKELCFAFQQGHIPFSGPQSFSGLDTDKASADDYGRTALIILDFLTDCCRVFHPGQIINIF